MQEILDTLIQLRKDFNGLANNYNQVVHKLHTLDHIPAILDWLIRYESDRIKLLSDFAKLKYFIGKTAD